MVAQLEDSLETQKREKTRLVEAAGREKEVGERRVGELEDTVAQLKEQLSVLRKETEERIQRKERGMEGSGGAEDLLVPDQLASQTEMELL
jgi:hypothetical protein